MVQFSWSDFLIFFVLKALGRSLGVNRMWTKKNDHAPKRECAGLFLYMSKKDIFEENSSLLILLSSLGLYLSSLLVKKFEDVACNERFNLYMFNVICM
jgi:hypothetical protein